MAEVISETRWKAFVKKQKLAAELDDKELLKALARLDKTDERKPEPRLEALKDLAREIPKQVAALVKLKKQLGDKPFGLVKDELYAILEEAEALQKQAQSELAAAAAEDDEGESPVLLTTKMVPLVKELRKGDVTMHALIGTAGRETAVLIMRRPISPSRRKLIGEAIDAKGGAKYIVGECRFEAQALTFIVKTQAAGLAKRLKAALQSQLEMRLKVRVRGEDPEDVDEDGEDEGEAQEGVKAQVPQAPAGGPATAEQLAYTQRLKKVSPRLEEALRGQHPESTRLRGVSLYAAEKAEAKDYAAATKALEMLEKLLGAPAAEPPAGTAGAPGRFVEFTQSRLAWDQTRKLVQSELKKLEREILAQCQAEPDRDAIAAGTRQLYEILEILDERLIDLLDDALNAATPEARKGFHGQAREVVDEYLDFINTEPLLQDIDGKNGFVDLKIRSTLTDNLNQMARQLGAAFTRY